MAAETLPCLARETPHLTPGRLESSGVWRDGLKPSHELGTPPGVPKDDGAVVRRGHGTGQPWAQESFAVGWVKFGVGSEHFGHTNPLAEGRISGHQLPRWH